MEKVEDKIEQIMEEEENCTQEKQAEEKSSAQVNETKKKIPQNFEEFNKLIEAEELREGKVEIAINFMESAIAQTGSPNFRYFWDARTLCIELFKGPIAPVVRPYLWTRYTELTRQARKLKDILNEHSAFATEQIDLAIKAIEEEMQNIDNTLEQTPLPTFPFASKTLEQRLPDYQKTQRELNFLNAQASRINSLRKELIRTEMRIRQKNKFFQRLSSTGDSIFPRRKELIKEISQAFMEDVKAFIDDHFSDEEITTPYYILRDEIKSLQGIAKSLTLNTHSFTNTRMELSKCWDQVKELEKERKKERAERGAEFKQNAQEILQRVNEFKEKFQANEMTTNEANKNLNEIQSEMRATQLGRDEIKVLRKEIKSSRHLIEEKLSEEEKKRQEQLRERERQRIEKLQELENKVVELLENAKELEVSKIDEEKVKLIDEIQNSPFNKGEKMDLERKLSPLRDVIAEKKEEALMSLSDDDREALFQLREVLKDRMMRRQEIKDQLEIYRKESGASGLDFEQAMSYHELINTEKERLDKINQGVEEIEQKIKVLENKNV